jgi:hypothetical protein
VILVGEMRDTETIDIALKAAETGHLVLSTVHTTDAAKTIGRLVGTFPAEEQHGVRTRLADNLRGVVSQRLLPRKDGKGRVVAAEIMVVTKTVQEYLKDVEKAADLKDVIEKGQDQYGMQSFDQHLTALYRGGQISLEVAMSAASNPSDFERALNFGDSSGPEGDEDDVLELDVVHEDSRPMTEAHALILDRDDPVLGEVALKLAQLVFAVHYTPWLDEGLLLVKQEEGRIRAILVPPGHRAREGTRDPTGRRASRE